MRSLRRFKAHYGDAYAAGVSSFLLNYGVKIVEIVREGLLRPHGTVYIFGNGGSYSIGQCLKYAIEEFADRRGLNCRVSTGIDVNTLFCKGEGIGSGISFVETLKRRGATAADLIIVISGSGDSSNLCAVAKFSRELGITCIGLIGSPTGRLRPLLHESECFIAPVEDQQISEDIIQSLVYAFENDFDSLSEKTRRKRIFSLASNLREAVDSLMTESLDELAAEIVENFVTAKPIWVMGFGHPALSACAEHTAHNLYWDGVYQVENPPARMVFSTPTGANLTGIANDRRKGIIAQLMGLDTCTGGSAIIFALEADRSVSSLVRTLAQRGVRCFTVSAHGQIRSRRSFRTRMDSPFAQAGVSQVFGHMLGRVVRLKLLDASDQAQPSRTKSEDSFLIIEDLAQRRLLNG